MKPAVKALTTRVTTEAVQVHTETLKLQQRLDELTEKQDELLTLNKGLKSTLDRQEQALQEVSERERERERKEGRCVVRMVIWLLFLFFVFVSNNTTRNCSSRVVLVVVG